MYVTPTEPKPIGTILADGFRLFAKAFKKVAPLTAAFMIISYLLFLPFQSLMMKSQMRDVAIFNAMKQGNAELVKAMPAIHIPATFWLVCLIVGILVLWFFGTLIRYIGKTSRGEEESIMRSLIFSLKKWPAMIISAIIVAILLMIGFVLLYIPGIYLSLLLGFFLYAILLDDAGIFSSIGISARFVWGNWWRTFTTFLGFFIIMMPFILVFSLIAMPLQMLIMFKPSGFITFIIFVVQLIFTLFFWPWTICTFVRVYEDLRLRWIKKTEKNSINKPCNLMEYL